MTAEPPDLEPIPVEVALNAVGDAIDAFIGEVIICGTIHGITDGPGWRRCELATHNRGQVTARIPVAIPPTTTLTRPISTMEGAEASIAGRFHVQPLYGPLQFLTTQVTIQANKSETIRQTENTLDELRCTGRIDTNKSLPLAERPQHIGLIAPLQGGAGGADFLDRLRAAHEVVQITSRYVPMGGPDALAEVIGAISELEMTDVDVIFICRGGGARTKLALFDTPGLLTTISGSPVPIIVAVGHAIDETAADLVCHTSLPTPSAAAAWLIDRRRHTKLIREAKIISQQAHEAQLAVQRAKAHESTAHRAERKAVRSRELALRMAMASIALVLLTIAVLVFR